MKKTSDWLDDHIAKSFKEASLKNLSMRTVYYGRQNVKELLMNHAEQYIKNRKTKQKLMKLEELRALVK
jgi:hypothetical protein